MRGMALPWRTGALHHELELRRTSIRPAHGTHDRTQGCDRADHGQHEQSHHQEECGPYIMEDDMIHRNFLPRNSGPTRCANHNGKATGPWDQLSSASIRNKGSALSTPAFCHDQCIRLASHRDVSSGVVHRIALSSSSGLHQPYLAYNGIGQKSMQLKWGVGQSQATATAAKYLSQNGISSLY